METTDLEAKRVEPASRLSTRVMRTFLKGMVILILIITALMLLASVALGPDTMVVARTSSWLDQYRWGFAHVRAGVLVTTLLAWSRIVRWMAHRNGWSEDYTTSIAPFGYRVLAGMLVVDVVLFNAPLWADLLRS